MYTYIPFVDTNNGCVRRWTRKNVDTGERVGVTLSRENLKPRSSWTQAEIEALFELPKVEEKIETSTERTSFWQESD